MRIPVMSDDELRYWIRELKENHGWSSVCLARVLGAYDERTLAGKLKGKWFYRGERKRFSRQLDRIISGELIPVKRKRNGVGWIIDPVLADNPVPLETKARMKVDLSTGRLGYVQPRLRPTPVLPSFASVLKDVEVYRGRSA